MDDNDAARLTLRKYLTKWGCEVSESKNGQHALASLRQSAKGLKPYHLAIIDLRMPGMDGWQLASEINADKNINFTKLILLTSVGLSGQEAKMKLLKWYDGYLSKPVKKGELLETVFKINSSDLTLETAEGLEPVDVIEEEKFHSQTEKYAKTEKLKNKEIKILVVEDHEVNQQLFTIILERLGYTVRVVSDGVEALKAVEEETYDLIFMDLQMPNMNGNEATERIRIMGWKMPIIAVTASAFKEDMVKSFQSGMNDYLTKPFKKENLLPVLSKWLDSEAGEREREVEVEQDQEKMIFDFKQAVETFMGREETVRRLLGSFREKVRSQIDAIREGIGQKDFDKIRNEAHAIKGGAWNLGAKKLGYVASKMEMAGKQEQLKN